ASPIQAAAIPVLLAGRDVVGQSQTGSGKTAAFAVPAIEKVDPQLRMVQVLILCPTRELAVQVAEEFHKLALFKRGIHVLPIYGGQSYERQFEGLRQGAQIVIGTPGRVMDHMRRQTLRLDKVKMVILDEADVMLDMGFREDIEFILQGVPTERQTVFFSATIPRPIQELIQKYSRDPQKVQIEQKALTVPTVEQVYYEVDRRFKIDLLTRLIDLHDLKLGIIFCNTKRMVDDLVDHLNAQGYSADRLHGDMSQPMRDRVMNKFRKSGLEFLVATDVAARGIDVENVEVVFNYDLPYDGEDYLHRIGRTGRAGRSGRAISFVAGRELFQIHQIERYTRVKMHQGKPPTAAEVEEARSDVLVATVRATIQGGEFKRQNHLIERLLEEGFNSTDIASALLHLFQSEQASTVSPASREEGGSRSERAFSGEGRRERENRPARREFSSDRHSSPSRKPWRSSEGAPHDGHRGHPQERRPSAPAPTTGSRTTTHPQEGRAPVPAPIGASKPAKAVFERRHIDDLQRPPAPKHSRRTPEDHTRLYINVGEKMGVTPGDVVAAILGETGLPAKMVGTVDIRERHLFVDVSTEHAHGIISKLNRTRIKDHKLKAKVA
ncbi:MAG TPA: DEAD/DEAH box helicase, partial [Verrucomicrobiae bacterium]|nr:DEAD/DEAH box helicase [Verrucomicrobiae bacterium]